MIRVHLPAGIDLRSRSLCFLTLAAFAFSLGASDAQAFRFGSTYDLVFNAFVDRPDGGPGLEGHVASNLIIDGIHDALPLNSVFPASIGGFDLRATETMELIADELQRVRPAEPMEIVIDSMEGGDLVKNSFGSGTSGRVSISVTDLVWKEGIGVNARLAAVRMRLYDSLGMEHVVDTPATVSGHGSLLSPWRISYSIPADEFGEDTQMVKLSFEGMALPEPTVPAIWLGLLLMAGARHRSGKRPRDKQILASTIWTL